MTRRLGYGSLAGAFLGLALAAAAFADLRISALDPWTDLGQVARGFVWPDVSAIPVREVVLTIAFAVTGVTFGASFGLAMALAFHHRAVRVCAAGLRSIHELFWALLLLQILGISPWTGVLAVGLPYAGIFAKVYAEIMEEADLSAERALPDATGALSRFLFVRAPILAQAFRSYTLYRLECGLRSSLVLGFIGIPTIGDEISSAFRPGSYHEAAALLLVFYALIATRGLWARASLLPLLIPGSLVALATLTSPLPGLPVTTRLANFLASIVPSPIRHGHGSLAAWLWDIAVHEVGPGLVTTLVLSQLAATAAALAALVLFPAISRRFTGTFGRALGRALLVVVRGTPDYMLAYMLLQLLGLSMLPAVLALGLHNGGIIAFLMSQHADALPYRRDAPRGLNLFAYETMPRLFGQFVALVLYRYEIIVRESAILGLLSIYTIGFYVQAAMSDFKLDRAVVLLIATGLVSAAVDATSRWLRARLNVADLPVRLSRSREATFTPLAPGLPGAALRSGAARR